jgi:fibronectin-binding autotransporter adhesin
MKRKSIFNWLPMRFAALVAPLIAAWPQRAQSAVIYWDNVGGTANDWGGVANWSTVVGGGTNPAAIPGTADVATFSASSVAAAQTVNLNAARSVLGLDFTTTLAHTLQGGSAAQTLTLGASGITRSGTGAVTIGSTTAAQNVNIALGANQTWTNSSATSEISSLNVISGGFSLGLAGSGTFRLAGANTYTGTTTVGAGTTLIAQNNGALGSTANGTTVNAGGTINLGGTLGADTLNLGAEVVTINGAGVGGIGALVNTSANQQLNALQQVVLGSDASIGGSARWDIRSGNLLGASLNGGGFSLTKVGTNQVPLVNVNVTGMNQFIISNGGMASEVSTLLSSGGVTGGVLIQPGAGNTAFWNHWGNSVTHTANYTLDTSAAANSTARFEVQNGSTTFNGNLTITGGGTNNVDVDTNHRATLNGNLLGTANFNKVDGGGLVLNGAANTHSGNININAGSLGGNATLASAVVNLNNSGALSPGNLINSAGTLNITNALTSSGANSAVFNLGTASDLVNAGTLTQNGTTSVSIAHSAGIAAGTYTLFDYGTLAGSNGFTGFALQGHVDGALQNNVGTGAIELVLNSAAPLTWTGANNGLLAPGSLTNPLLPNFAWAPAPGGRVDYVAGDNLLFDDSATGTTSITVTGTVAPNSLRFNNSSLDYTIDGAFTGLTGLVKDGTGTATLLATQTFNGPVAVNAGTLQLGNHSRAAIIGSSSSGFAGSNPAITIAAGATLGISNGGNAELNVSNNISGAGNIVLNATQQDQYYNALADRGNTAFRGDNSGFTGGITINDGNRLRANSANALGNASGITIADGGALLADSPDPVNYSGPISVAGQGWQEVSGYGGALRLNNGATFSGPVTLTGDSRFTAWNNSSATLSGAISGAHALEFGFRQIGANSSGTYNLPNPGSSYSGDTTITRMNINAATLADAGTNSSFGSGSALNLELAAITLSGATAGADAMTSNRTIRLNQLGIGGASIGLTDAQDSLRLTGPIITGNSSFGLTNLDFLQRTTPGTGGTIIIDNNSTTRVSSSTIHRQNLTIAGSSIFEVGYPATGTAVSPFGAPGGFNVGNNVSAADAGPVTLTIQDTATLTAYGDFDIGNQNSGAAITTIVNQTGGTVNALKGGGSFTNTDAGNRAMRIGHWPNNNATYNLSGGTLNVTNGYMNVAWDGNGTLNQSAGTTANIRGLRLGNSNTVTGIYNLNGGTLNMGDLGMVRGGTGTAHALVLNGGTYRAAADHNIGSGININVGAGGGIIDTNGFSVFSASALLAGAGPGGLTKIGDGLFELPSGNSTYTGPTAVNGGFLGGTGAAPAITASNVSVNNGGAVSGNLTFSAAGTSLTVNSGGTVTPGALGGGGLATITATTATLNAGANLNITPGAAGTRDFFNVTGASGLTTPAVGTANLNVLPVGTLAAGTYDLVGYNTAIAGGGFAGIQANLPHLLGASVTDNGAGLIQLTLTGQESLTWTGGTNGTWNNAGANVNWNASASGAVNYLQGDVAVFDSTTAPANTAITIAPGGVTPASVTINDVTGVFSFTGGGIHGGTSLVKDGAGTTVLATNNTYAGTTTINAGTLQIGNGGTSGSLGALNTVTNNGTLSFNRSDATNVYNTISGTGAVRSDGTGTTTLTAANGYAGGTVIARGTMVGRTATSFGSGTITLNDASTGSADTGLYFNPLFNDTAITVANNIVVASQGTGTVRLGSNERSNRLQGTIFTGTVALGRDVTMMGEFDRTTFTNVISGTADTITIAPSPGLSPGQPGRVTWEASNTFTPASAAFTTINILDGAVLQTGVAAIADQIPDTATVNVQAGGTLQFGVTGDSETIGTLTGAGTVRNVTNTPLSLTFGTAADAVFTGVLSGGNQMSFIKQGTGTQTIGGVLDNASTGITVNAGTVLLAKTSTPTVHALGGATTINNGGTLMLGGSYIDTRPASDGRAGNNTIPRNAPANYVDQIFNDLDITVNTGGTFDLGGRSEAFDALLGTGTVTNSVAGTSSTLFLSANGAGGTWSGTIQDGAGVVNLAKGGTGGTITLATANTYSGTTEIRGGGGITINDVNALGSTAGATTLSANRDGAALLTLAVTVASDPSSPNILAEPLHFISETSGDQRTNVQNNNESMRLTGPITVTGDGIMQINANQAAGDQFQVNSSITGTANGILFLRGAGEMQLNGVINAPNLQIAKTEGSLLILNSTGHDYFETSWVHGTVRTDVVNAMDTGAVLRMGQGANGNTLDINGNNQTVAGVRMNLDATTAQARTITNSSGTAADFTVNVPLASGGNYNYTGNLTGNLSLVKSGPGVQALSTPLSGTNSYTGNTVINEGVLRLGNSNLIPDGASTGNLIAGTGANSAAFDLNGNSETINGLHGNGSGVITSNGVGTATLTVNGTATPLTSATFAGILQNNTDGGPGVLGLTKSGAGTQILTGISTYSGATLVTAGELRINGSIASSSLTTVNSGATLSGSGIVGPITLDVGSSLSPGNSPGVLTTGSATSSADVNIEIGGPTPGNGTGFHDQIVTNGALALNGGNLSVSLVDGYVPSQTISFDIWLNDGADLIGGTGSFTGKPEGFGDPGSWPVPETADPLDFWSITYAGGTGNDIRLTYIPEPSSAFLAAAAGLLALNRRRRAK